MFLCCEVLDQLCVISNVLKDLLPRSDSEWWRAEAFSLHARDLVITTCSQSALLTRGQLRDSEADGDLHQRCRAWTESGIIRGCVYKEEMPRLSVIEPEEKRRHTRHIPPCELTDSIKANIFARPSSAS